MLTADLEKAFALLKTMPFSGFVRSKLEEVFEIYVEQKTLNDWRKAYEVAFLEQQYGVDVQSRLDKIIEKCLTSPNEFTEQFLGEVLKHYPKCGEIVSPKALDPLQLKALQDSHSQKSIEHLQAEQFAQQRKFKEAIGVAESIKNPDERSWALCSIAQKCCEIGEDEAIDVAIKIALHPDRAQMKNVDLLIIVKACQQLRRKDLALKAVQHIEENELKKKWVAKIENFFARSATEESLKITEESQEKQQTSPSNLGNYFQDQDLSQLAKGQKAISPSELSKLIRSGTHQKDLFEAIEKAESVTDENLCDALDRELTIPLFQKLIDKAIIIGESPLTCAIYQDRAEELRLMLISEKTNHSPENLFEKAKTRKMKEAIATWYPTLKSKIEDIPPPSTPSQKVPPNLRKEEGAGFDYLSFLMRKGNIDSELKSKAINGAKERNFITARFSVEAISDNSIRRGVVLEVFKICYQFGDREALECALNIAKMQEVEKNAYLEQFIEDCKKFQDRSLAKELSIKAADALTDPYLKEKYLKQLNA